MNNWIEQNKKWFIEHMEETKCGTLVTRCEAIPVSALEELFSKEGEEIKFEMADNYVNNSDEIQEKFSNNNNELPLVYGTYVAGFEEAYNLQQVKIEALKKEVEELRGALTDLVQLKNWKDKYGKDGHYLTNVDNVWLHARLLVEPLNPQP